jgi:Zn-dependent peptidase ImmA (M78 family)
MENAGIIVVINGILGNNTHRRLNPEEFRGFVIVDDVAPLVFVNGSDSKAAQMFTLAHELAHVFLGSSAAFDLRGMQPAENPIELCCNRVAAEFLLDERSLKGFWPLAKVSPEIFQTVARYFKVSTLVAARRALDLGLINKTDFFNYYESYRKRNYTVSNRRAEGGDFYATQNLRIGQRFASAVVRATKEGKLLYSEAYHLTGLYGRAFDRFAATLGPGA